MEYTKLSNGVQVPMEGLGVFQIEDLDQCERVGVSRSYVIDGGAEGGNTFGGPSGGERQAHPSNRLMPLGFQGLGGER